MLCARLLEAPLLFGFSRVVLPKKDKARIISIRKLPAAYTVCTFVVFLHAGKRKWPSCVLRKAIQSSIHANYHPKFTPFKIFCPKQVISRSSLKQDKPQLSDAPQPGQSESKSEAAEKTKRRGCGKKKGDSKELSSADKVQIVACDSAGERTETRDPEPNELGFKDTVIAYPGEITKLRMRFDIPGLFVWHCHILYVPPLFFLLSLSLLSLRLLGPCVYACICIVCLYSLCAPGPCVYACVYVSKRCR